jgi:hypothetical protein
MVATLPSADGGSPSTGATHWYTFVQRPLWNPGGLAKNPGAGGILLGVSRRGLLLIDVGICYFSGPSSILIRYLTMGCYFQF